MIARLDHTELASVSQTRQALSILSQCLANSHVVATKSLLHYQTTLDIIQKICLTGDQ